MLKQKSYLIMAIALPIIMIIIVIYFTNFYQDKMNPQANIVYALIKSTDSYVCEDKIKSKLLPNLYPTKYQTSSRQNANCEDLKLYIYNFETSQNYPLSLSQFLQLQNQVKKEINSFKINYYCDTGSPILWWGPWSSPGVCLTNGNYRERLNIDPPVLGNGDYNHFIFLGWVPQTTELK